MKGIEALLIVFPEKNRDTKTLRSVVYYAREHRRCIQTLTQNRQGIKGLKQTHHHLDRDVSRCGTILVIGNVDETIKLQR